MFEFVSNCPVPPPPSLLVSTRSLSVVVSIQNCEVNSTLPTIPPVGVQSSLPHRIVSSRTLFVQSFPSSRSRFYIVFEVLSHRQLCRRGTCVHVTMRPSPLADVRNSNISCRLTISVSWDSNGLARCPPKERRCCLRGFPSCLVNTGGSNT